MVNVLTVGALREILSILSDETLVYVRNEQSDDIAVKSWVLSQYGDGVAELVLCSDEMLGLNI